MDIVEHLISAKRWVIFQSNYIILETGIVPVVMYR